MWPCVKCMVDFPQPCDVQQAQNSRVPPVLSSQTVWSPSDTKTVCDDSPIQFDCNLRRTGLSREGQRQLRGCSPQGPGSRCSGSGSSESANPVGVTESLQKPRHVSLSLALGESGDCDGTVHVKARWLLYARFTRTVAKVFVCLGSPLSRF